MKNGSAAFCEPELSNEQETYGVEPAGNAEPVKSHTTCETKVLDDFCLDNA